MCFVHSSELIAREFRESEFAKSIGADIMVMALNLGLSFGTIAAFAILAISCACNPL
jgi:predicted hydrolase (HD superfamily)